jgi:hypothetical protein
MVDFNKLKSNSGNLDKLTKALERSMSNSGGNSSDDDKFWKCETDKAGNGYAVIRFLPAPEVDGEDGIPWVTVYTHGFQGPGGWYIENSLTTINEKDPVSEYNSELWNSGIEANKEIARKQKRRMTYISNVLVVEDPKHPENNGKVFLFKYGKKIFEKITDAMNPPPEFGETPINPFDMWSGANFKLKIRKVDGYQNYDKSEFDSPSEIYDGDDAKLEKLWKSEHSLKDFLDKKHFKSYDELKVRLARVLGTQAPTTNQVADTPKPQIKTTTIESASSTPETPTPEIDVPWVEDEDTMMLDHFSALALDD